MKIHKLLVMLLIGLPVLLPKKSTAQTGNNDKQLSNATLQEVIDYALNNRPGVKQSLIDEEIGELRLQKHLNITDSNTNRVQKILK